MHYSDLFKDAELKLGGRSYELLDEFEASGFIMTIPNYGKKRKEYKLRLVDEYSLFYLTWIDHDKHFFLQGIENNYWEKVQASQAWHIWAGYAFENICLKHVSKIKEALEIGGVLTQESHWQYSAQNKTERGAEIDLVIDRADQCINLCEIKFYNSLYTMTKLDAENLERKKNIFREKTGTRKAIFLTLITPFGVAENEYYLSSVNNQLTLDALF